MPRKYTEWDINEEEPAQFQETVNAFIGTLIKPELLKRDLFFALLLVLMEENNFHLVNEDDGGDISVTDYISFGRHLKNDFCESLLTLRSLDEVPLKLIMTPIDDAVLIICTIPCKCAETYSVVFQINRYILSTKLGVPSHLSNTDELCLIFKTGIITPIKKAILCHHGLPSGALTGLPTDVLHQILFNLPIRSILHLSETCKRFNDVVNESSVWARLYVRDFAGKHKTDEKDYRVVYRELYVKKQKDKIGCSKTVCAGIFEESPKLPDYMRYVPDSRREVIL